MSGTDGTSAGRAVCAGCGCVCDDIPLDGPDYRPGRPNVETDCRRGRRWFARQVFGGALVDRRPAVDGDPASLADAAERAAEILAAARHPRVAGLAAVSLAAQRKLVELADRTGADVDTDSSARHLASVLAVQRDGGPFLTLGEIRDRVDCLVLWYVEPGRSHPRLLERFYAPGGDAGEGAGEGRTLVAVGPGAEEVGADVALPVPPDSSLEFLWLVRLLADDPEAPERDEHPLGGAAGRLVERLRAADCGAWIYDGDGADGAAAGRREGDGAPGVVGPVEASGVLRLLARLNEEAPWGARPLRGEGNLAGAEAVLSWQTGYPAAVTYRSGRPRYAGAAYADGHGAGRDGVDVVLLAGGRPSSLPSGGRPLCVWLDAGAREEGTGPDGRAPDGPSTAVRIPVLPVGARPGDTVLRMDGLPVRSPGLPGAEGWDGTPAEEAVDAILGKLVRARREGAPR